MSMFCARSRWGSVLALITASSLLACDADGSDASSGPSAGPKRDHERDEDSAGAEREDDENTASEGDDREDNDRVMDAQAADSGPRGSNGRSPDAGVRASDASADASDRPPRPLSDAAATPVATCASDAMLAPGETNGTIRVNGVSRTYLLHVPPTYTGEEPVPLVLDWHGLFFDGAAQRDSSGYAELSDREGFIVAFPDGIDNAWNVGPCCTLSRDVDDVAFARALVAEIERVGCIDPKRVYSTGFSNGGGMTMHLACNAADLFAAIAPASFDLLAEDEQPCQPARPISIINFRGMTDLIVPYEGGASNPPNGLPTTIHFRGARGTFEFWKEANGCTGSPTTSDGCETYADCEAGVQTTLCAIDDLVGHLPGDAELGWATMKRYTLP